MEQINVEKEEKQLSASELSQLDEVIRSARRFNYLSLLVATLLAVIVLEEDMGSVVRIPLWNVTLPRLTTGMGLHFTVVVFTILSYTTIRRVWYFMRIDQRRTPYPWYAITYKNSRWPTILWLMLPPTASGFFVAFFATDDTIGLFFALLSPFFVLSFPTLSFHWDNILAKTDERGGQATLSIYLLYWYRTLRSVLFLGLLTATFLSISPNLRNYIEHIAFPFWPLLLSIFVVRIISGLGPVYRFIDFIGTKLGFPKSSKHYK